MSKRKKKPFPKTKKPLAEKKTKKGKFPLKKKTFLWEIGKKKMLFPPRPNPKISKYRFFPKNQQKKPLKGFFKK